MDPESSTPADPAPGGKEASELMKSDQNQISYGATELGSEGMIPADRLCPLRLLAKSWGMLAPVLGPLFVIVTLNAAAPHDLTMDCENHHEDLGTIKFMCALTLPGVRLFPRMGIILGLLLLAWRMVHERGYYVLMKNKIMVDLDAGKRFGYWVMLIMGSLFGVACLHLILKVFAGHACNNDDTCGQEYMFKSTMSELLRDPRVFASEKNYMASQFLSMAILKFVVPGVVCISSLSALLNLENELIPLSKLLEHDPTKAYRDLGEFVYLPEEMLRTIIREEGLELCKAESRCEIADVSRELFEKAQEKGCVVLGSTRIPELAQEKAPSEVVTHAALFARVKELLYIDWWPMKILIDTNLTGKQSLLFKQIIGMHYCGTILAILLMASRAIHRFIEYGGILFADIGHNWPMLFPELVLGVELFCQGIWIMQAWKYAKYAIPDPETVAMVRVTMNDGMDKMQQASANVQQKLLTPRAEAQEVEAPAQPESENKQQQL